MTNAATRNQNAAADPAYSTWLSANAGSGKTRVLTDRVARMLLRKVPPENILCLTYTKAAAGEMQNRLFKRLGKWAMLDDDKLASELAELGETEFTDYALARTLFAQAIETPGGLKIQTIHAFCATLLRQFPLESGVSPQFRELDDAGMESLISDVLDSLADQPALAGIASHYSGENLADLARVVASERGRFDPPMSADAVFALHDVPVSTTEDALIAQALAPGDLDFLRQLAPLAAASEKSSDQKFAAQLASLPRLSDLGVIAHLESILLTGADTQAPFTPKKYPPTGDLRKGSFAPHIARFDSIRDTIADTRPLRVAFQSARQTAALHAFAALCLPAYEQAKADRAVLDFDDLIDHAQRLLTDQSLAWVLYRLDGGIDHILVDEAQDTSPAQWQVIRALSEELTAGQGARAGEARTLFVVGDKKQSIYSFQGADAREFDATFTRFQTQLEDGPGLNQRELPHSFRSSAAILNAVDHTFVGDAADGLGHGFRHIAFHEIRAGRVDLWPLIEKPPKPEDPEWYDPVDRKVANDPAVLLAEKIASQIKHMIAHETLPTENGGFRPITAGDFLILVQRRSDLFDQIIQACKRAELPMAGADRLKISGELAVRDLLALLSFLALPEDDLSLAAALRSPIFGWSEAQLYSLANGRMPKDPKKKPPYLWETLRKKRDNFPETVTILDDLRRQTDFQRPYELLERILTDHGGRRALLSRLGPEAEDGIDELLNQALAFEQDEVPSLTAFLARASADAADIKRQPDTTDGLIRVMTVHGAKGLEAPIVILPDTTRAEKTPSNNIVVAPDDTPLWRAARAESPPALEDALDHERIADREERQRLLYVAMTRAESWLIACGVAPGNAPKVPHWHDLIGSGLKNAGAAETTTDAGEVLRLQHGDWGRADTFEKDDEEYVASDSPDWLTGTVTPPRKTPDPVTPSNLGGDKVLPGDGSGLDEPAAKERGTRLHLLLEHLPSLPPAGRRQGARQLIGTDALTDEALTVIEAHPQIFSETTLAEVEITAHLPALDRRLDGTIDRLRVTDTDILAVDFKTNALVPQTLEDTPARLLRQMGGYLAALKQIWPDRQITLAILWTTDASLMEIPHDIARRALEDATTS